MILRENLHLGRKAERKKAEANHSSQSKPYVVVQYILIHTYYEWYILIHIAYYE